ncbi:MAG: DnaJ domain-containing protein, partial [Eubacterium sp.]|nr:DnaJ domain-containing protein [Eubacterium sp.]
MTDPYRVLEVSREATDHEIKKAYRNKSRKYHPDSYADESQKKWAEEKFREVQEAYNQIVDER